MSICNIQNINTFKILIIITLLISGCSEHKVSSPGEIKGDLKNAVWITDSQDWPLKDADMFADNPAPLFRKEFSVKEEVKSATLFITAAGYYTAFINGEKIGKNILDPAWTKFSKRIYYSEYDLTGELKIGINVIGTTLGNGFYNPLPMKLFGKYNLQKELPSGKPALIARLVIEYKSGDTEEIITDTSWKHSYGTVLKNNVYLGEVYDGRKEISGWNMTDYNDTEWHKSVQFDGPGGILQKAFFPPVRVTGTIAPVSVKYLPEGRYIVDMGVNFTGVYRIRLKGEKGDTVVFRFGERLYDNGELNPMTQVAGQIKRKGMAGEGAPDIAWQTDRYIFGDKQEVWYTPSFTFHIFRYMEITGLNYKPELSDIEGIAFNTNVETTGTFSSSNELFNKIQEITRRTFTDNLISVQSDCPGREKFGYGGDLNATAESFIYNYDMHSFYRKTIYDWVDAMNDSVFIDTAPFVGIVYCGISWESAFLITQYRLLQYYNDTALVREMYQQDLEWMEKAAQLHPEGIVKTGLADHESLQKVPVELIGTTHYLDCARIMAHFASIMNDTENESRFRHLADRLKNMVLNIYCRKNK
ncbi:MAG: family 78 glycoside hydrolase catalytic domain [Bacteroidia bacterium]|nr:family 78 glycoside hydrolase catalytic domain [Bacteroidia bacterium]